MTPHPWRKAWYHALYGPSGFYTRTEGPAGHFSTSAQGIPGVAEILAQAVMALAEHEGADTIVDFACGRGELLRTLSCFVPDRMTLAGVDVVPRPHELPPNIKWLRSPGGGGIPRLDALSGRRVLVLAHEWLDVVPCDIIEIDEAGTPRIVLVSPDGTESLGSPFPLPQPRLSTASADTPGHDVNTTDVRELEPGERIEVPEAREAAWSALVAEVGRCAEPGSVVLGVDYAMWAAQMSPLGTLTAFRDGTECPPVPDGTCDLTSHVVLDGLEVSEEPRRQRDILVELFGEASLHPVPIELASENPADYLERLATRSALATATARGGLGDFFWFIRRV